ncbi:type II CRISPR-associated endonuclease Cas1 [Shewanella sp. KX20019]|uniref:type II CRISPR-associated endonuclease Cas1 n=1 Tax=Shewanella sp. KX20019 TaxID=2803864 RepID=UPI0019255604|nr:type II CRISPR-associated endonuclease Cas1 [Shewanella sp. KX20019]QQX81674.1 type II CRISPR-associated endonuclease Cas1 [Shewanella sp. KX20019]
MIKRVIDISHAAYLHIKDRQLCIDKNRETVATVAVEDIGVLLLAHKQVVFTQSVMVLCQQHNVAVIFCDDKHLPLSLSLPLFQPSSLHSLVLKQQISVSKPIHKRLWQQIIKQKIIAQSAALIHCGKSHEKIVHFATKVKSGDPNNVEAQAAKHYWHALFGENFRRNRELEGLNQLLNYGYMVLRACVARALVGSGLHPALGIFHQNQYNNLSLADDIVEPFRPFVDIAVYDLQEQGVLEVTQEAKQILLGLISKRVTFKGESMPLMNSLHFISADLKRNYTKEMDTIIFPTL